ncbi:xanthine dehydrogenase accessory protein XdhC [Pollutimonas harenae]|uniref:Xanthine dehydrogenase accessory protein XdhC n=1 Tax=Pollutimonas harenae TaxID=657015 RepID=A0A853GXP0_9BURK|nr:xanthine dehydrogenase accessory protein XdhC [Pollutimonas harenae]NYT84550.1 xanthine dehydrogenase accessory protein XdhC [Pollutimonas harenae]TEA73057.1 xanthine dehydrogenase accessory protein XdhC [Pollutimonas harenae]
MHDWIHTAQQLLSSGEPAVLVTLVKAEGSTPREAGTRMLFTADRQWSSIGGGQMEWRAADIARDMLAGQQGYGAHHVERIPLGPRLGQCCGGVATLAFDLLTQALLDQEAAARQPPDQHLVLFGAGHVGRALVPILGSLPCTVLWVDERDAQFPEAWPANVSIEVTDTPEAVVDQAPPGSYFLVVTHCHALDLRLCRQILKRDDFAYFGLIGSQTKRHKFERRLRERGVPDARLARMICPIGVPGIRGKAPEIIAVAVAAQLLQAREQYLAATHLPAGADDLLPLPLIVPTLGAKTE